jgi:hypothetical protein
MNERAKKITDPKSTLTVCLAFLAATVPAFSEISLGNKGALALGVDADLEYDSNISANANEDGDTIGTMMPKVLYRYDEGIVLVDAFAGVEFREYNKESQFDSENFKSRIRLRYPEENDFEGLSWVFSGGFNESTTADDDLQAIVERERITGELTLRYDLADRYYLRGGLDYFDEETITSGFSDIESISLPVDFFYRYSETLAYGFGVEFSDVSVDSAVSPTPDSEDVAVYGAVEGRPLELVETELRLGWQQRDFDAGAFKDADTFFMEALLRWLRDERTTVEMSAGSGFRNTARNQSIEEQFVKLSGEHRFDDKLKALVFATVSTVDFESLNGVEVRSDDRWAVGLDTTYELIEDQLGLEFALRYSDQSSDVAAADFEDSSIRLGVSYIF